jgi:hypothetical protein
MVNPTTQLWAPLSVFKGVPNGTATSSQFVWTLNNVAEMADSVGDTAVATAARAQANATSAAVNSLLWMPDKGFYAVSTTDGNFSYIDGESIFLCPWLPNGELCGPRIVAFSIISGVSTGDRTTSQLAKLQELKYGIGYLADSTVIGSNETTLSPYLSGFLLEAMGRARDTADMAFLLDGLFSAMAVEGDNYSGGSWEYVVSLTLIFGLDFRFWFQGILS